MDLNILHSILTRKKKLDKKIDKIILDRISDLDMNTEIRVMIELLEVRTELLKELK